MKKVFIDGNSGTTGLKIYSRLKVRSDIEILNIDYDKRRDLNERLKLINESDYTFLCLPDDASNEIVSNIKNKKVIIIDTSTTHRTNLEWIYGFPELDVNYRKKIRESKRISIPGCYACGFNSIVYPLVKKEIIDKDFNIFCFGISGYTGAGKKGINQYENSNRNYEFKAPKIYGLNQNHKHLKEMKYISSLSKEPIFVPTICNYPQGMIITIPFYTYQLNKNYNLKDIYNFFKDYYKGTDIIKVREIGYSKDICANKFSNRDDMEIEINGNSERIIITARFDNLGKGASGAAIQCLNISMGVDEKTGLNIGS